jgi:hypothetical protein
MFKPNQAVKFTANVRKACPFHSASQQAREWNETTTILIVVCNNGSVWTKNTEAYPIGCSGNKVASLKWKEKSHKAFCYITIEQWLANINALPADFKGAPKGCL